MIDAGEMKPSITVWCRSARFESRIPHPNASVSTVEREARCVGAGVYTKAQRFPGVAMLAQS